MLIMVKAHWQTDFLKVLSSVHFHLYRINCIHCSATGTISKSEGIKQVMDSLQVERERGITVKAQTASIIYKHYNVPYLLNFVDTPVGTFFHI